MVIPTSFGLRTPPLALRNVIHGGRRSLAAISGVAFSLTMVLLQLGFLEAVRITAINNFDQLDFDLVLLSPRYEQFYAPGFFPRDRLFAARSLGTVVSASPLVSSFSLWRCPAYPVNGNELDAGSTAGTAPPPSALSRWLEGAGRARPLQRRELFVIGIDLERNPFHEPIRGRIEAEKPMLRLRNRLLLNELSHPDFGWQIRDQVDRWELGSQAVTVAGGFPMLRGFAADSTVICNDESFSGLCGIPTDRVSLGLLKVREGTEARSREELKVMLPRDVEILTRAEILARETDHWVNQTSTGQLFAFGVLVAMVVATVVVYQVLSNDVREHLPEYATLKAMGYSQSSLARVVVEQSLIYMIIAYLIAVVIGLMVYRATQELAGIPMRMTAHNLGLTLLLAVVVGLFSGFLSLSKLRGAQPAELF
jgi:putative ABC transport system permease protein